MKIQKNNLSIIIVAGNEESMIEGCLKSCLWADEIVLVAANSNDRTKTLAKKIFSPLKIIETNDEYNKNFSKWRNLGYKNSSYQWILYIDADERISLSLQKEILTAISSENNFTHFAIPRANYFLGKRVKFGGSYPDYVKRLFNKKFFKGYLGILHEQPVVEGELGYLKSDLVHYTHRDLNSMLNKTLAWTDMEAEALFKNNHPQVVWWRFPRMILTKLWERLIQQQMWRDGIVGFISAIFESFDTFIIYAKLWELQQKNEKNIKINKKP